MAILAASTTVSVVGPGTASERLSVMRPSAARGKPPYAQAELPKVCDPSGGVVLLFPELPQPAEVLPATLSVFLDNSLHRSGPQAPPIFVAEGDRSPFH